MKIYYLISSEDASKLEDGLLRLEGYVDGRCRVTGCSCMDATKGVAHRCSRRVTDLLHLLGTGLHVTDMRPADDQEAQP
jgi:hypothetical protein